MSNSNTDSKLLKGGGGRKGAVRFRTVMELFVFNYGHEI